MKYKPSLKSSPSPAGSTGNASWIFFDALTTSVHRHNGDQWLRAAQSIPLNVAKGNGKQSLNDKNHFIEFARGSAFRMRFDPGCTAGLRCDR
jgi:hypothetical protein